MFCDGQKKTSHQLLYQISSKLNYSRNFSFFLCFGTVIKAKVYCKQFGLTKVHQGRTIKKNCEGQGQRS